MVQRAKAAIFSNEGFIHQRMRKQNQTGRDVLIHRKIKDIPVCGEKATRIQLRCVAQGEMKREGLIHCKLRNRNLYLPAPGGDVATLPRASEDGLCDTKCSLHPPVLSC